MSPVLDPESKRKHIETAVKLGVIGVGLALAVPLLYLALEGLMLAVALGASALVLWGVAPGAAQFVANKRIALLKAAIAENPIETMEGIAAEKQGELNAQSKAITAVNTQYLNVQSKLDNLPANLRPKAANFQAIADKLKLGLDNMRKRYDYAANELMKYRGKIDEATSLWDIACAVNEAIKVSEKAKLDTFRDIKNQVAFDTVTTSLNHAFAALDEEVRVNQTITDLGNVQDPDSNDSSPKAIPAHVEGEVIDLSSVHAGQKITVR